MGREMAQCQVHKDSLLVDEEMGSRLPVHGYPGTGAGWEPDSPNGLEVKLWGGRPVGQASLTWGRQHNKLPGLSRILSSQSLADPRLPGPHSVKD